MNVTWAFVKFGSIPPVSDPTEYGDFLLENLEKKENRNMQNLQIRIRKMLRCSISRKSFLNGYFCLKSWETTISIHMSTYLTYNSNFV